MSLLSADLDPVSTQSWVVGGQFANYPVESQCQDSDARQDNYRAAKWNSLSLQWTNCIFHPYSPEPQLPWSQISYCYYYWSVTICRFVYVGTQLSQDGLLFYVAVNMLLPWISIQKEAGRDRLTFKHASEFWGWQRLQGLSRLPRFLRRSWSRSLWYNLEPSQ